MQHTSNLVTGRQLRAARVLAGMTQKTLAEALGINERAVRFWERKHDRPPTSAPNDARAESARIALEGAGWQIAIFEGDWTMRLYPGDAKPLPKIRFFAIAPEKTVCIIPVNDGWPNRGRHFCG